MVRQFNLNQAKTEFLTLASHQLRTPISAIKWFTEMLLHGDAGTLSEEQRTYIKQIYDSNMRLVTIVDDMLMATSIELNSLPIRPEPIDISALCHRVFIDQLHIQHTHKELKITEIYDPSLTQVEMDPTITRTILRNILSNAIKYTPNGGSVNVTISRSSKKITPDSLDSVRITVEDTGYGIPKNEQKNIFAKLFRATNIKDKDTDGTGLGLYLVKSLLQRIGGRISFKSEEKKGTTFTLYLPLSVSDIPSLAAKKETL